ncbi:hypothetical protein WJX79_007954 [Trebouxia sp. C0005]
MFILVRQPPVTIPVVPAVPGNVSSSGEFVKQKTFEASKTTLGDKLGIQDWSISEVQVSGLDVVVNYTSPAEVCLQPALDAANLGSLNNLKAVSESQLQSIQQLVAMWNMDVMYEGMQGVTTLFTKGGYTISLKTISLESRAVALVAPPSLDLGPIYRWVLVLQRADDDTTVRFGVI